MPDDHSPEFEDAPPPPPSPLEDRGERTQQPTRRAETVSNDDYDEPQRPTKPWFLWSRREMRQFMPLPVKLISLGFVALVFFVVIVGPKLSRPAGFTFGVDNIAWAPATSDPNALGGGSNNQVATIDYWVQNKTDGLLTVTCAPYSGDKNNRYYSTAGGQTATIAAHAREQATTEFTPIDGNEVTVQLDCREGTGGNFLPR